MSTAAPLRSGTRSAAPARASSSRCCTSWNGAARSGGWRRCASAAAWAWRSQSNVQRISTGQLISVATYQPAHSPTYQFPIGPMRIAVIPGDGIGVETTAEAVKAIRAVGEVFGRQFDLEPLPWSAEHFLQTGVTIPPDGYAM